MDSTQPPKNDGDIVAVLPPAESIYLSEKFRLSLNQPFYFLVTIWRCSLIGLVSSVGRLNDMCVKWEGGAIPY